MVNIYTFTVNQSHLRLDQYLVKKLPDYSRSKIQSYIKSGQVTINGETGKPSLILRGNETVECHFEPKIDDESIYLGSTPSTSVSSVQFESIANYQEAKFHELQGIDPINPLILVNKYVKQTRNNEFYSKDFAIFSSFLVFT